MRANRSLTLLPLCLLASCSGGGSEGELSEPPPSGEAQVSCGEADVDKVTETDQGLTAKQDDEGLFRVGYAAVFSVDDSIRLAGAVVHVSFVDSEGEPVKMMVEESHLSQPMTGAGADGHAVTGQMLLKAKPAKVEYDVHEVCSVPKGAKVDTVEITAAQLDVEDDEATLSVDVASSIDEPADVGTTYVFRDADGAVLGGTNDQDGALTISGVPQGESQHRLTFAWDEDSHPDAEDIDTVDGYAILPQGTGG